MSKIYVAELRMRFNIRQKNKKNIYKSNRAKNKRQATDYSKY
jgi:hypothetical protein